MNINVDQLSNFIRSVDGNHSLGAGVLAENICGWLAALQVNPPEDEYQKFIDSLDGDDKMFEQIEKWAYESYRRHKSSVRGQQITYADNPNSHYIWATLRWAKEKL